MKRIVKCSFILIILLVNSNVIYSQGNGFASRFKTLEKKADYFFENEEYFKASDLYSQLVKSEPSNSYAKIKLAECYRLLNKSTQSELLYAELFKKESNVASINKLNYSRVLLQNGKSDSAFKYLKQYHEANPNDSTVLNELIGVERYSDYYQDSLASSVIRLNINSDYSEINPIYYKEGILFLSQRPLSTSLIKVKESRNNQEFYRFYYSKLLKENEFERPIPEQLFTHTMHDGPFTLFDNNRKIVFSRNNKSGKEGKKNLKLYYSSYNESDKTWSTPILLPLNIEGYSFSHPFYFENNKTLYFASNKPEGFGGTDLYSVTFSDGVWGDVKNLGKQINTSRDEMFPFVSADSSLYFSSNGYPGMGGLDIFVTDFNQTNEVLNLGYPVNSSFDDFAFRLNNEGRVGMMSSNRKNKGVDDDIYIVKFHTVRFEGLVVDRLKLNPIENAEIKIIDNENGKVIRTIASNKKGKYYYPVVPGRKYAALVSKNNYKSVEFEFSSSSKEESTIKNRVVLEKVNKSFVKGLVVNDTTPLANSKVVFIDLVSDSTESAFTDSLGSFQCEIATDTTNLFYVEKGELKSIYALKPIKRKRKGSGMSFITIPVQEIQVRLMSVRYLDSLNKPIVGDTIIIKNELSKAQEEFITGSDGKVNANLWNVGKYSVYRKEAGQLKFINRFFPEGLESIDLKMSDEQSEY